MYQDITIVGNLGKDPEMRYTPSGSAVTSFSVGVNRKYKDNSGETVKETTWFKVSAWGKAAESCNQYLSKGDLVLVVGRLVPDKETGGPRIWTGDDGTPHAQFEISANDVRFLKTKGSDQRESSYSTADSGGDDIPF